MKGYLCLIVLLVGLLGLAVGKPQSPQPKVEYVKYKSDAEADRIVQSIIAQYEQLGGSSQFHELPVSQNHFKK